MSRTENFRDYKARMIDPKGPGFCAAKWNNATIWLNSGETTSCHHPASHGIDKQEILTNPSAIHNTQHKKQMRKQMLDGVRPAECSYCWKIEDFNRDAISDRVYKTIIYSDDEVNELINTPWDADVTLKTLEIAFDRACNFACSYCSAGFSTTWAKDIKENGEYTGLDSGGHYSDQAAWAIKGGRKEEDNPYIQAFWKWWESDLNKSLDELRVTGGEPLMHPSVWKLFDWFASNKSSKMKFAINSNLVPEKASVMDKLIKVSHHVNRLEIYTSNESIGAQSEYIRDGMDYVLWKENLIRLLDESNVHRIHMMMTINSLCLDSITEFMDEMLALRDDYGHRAPSLSVNILRFPNFQSIAVMPEGLRHFYRDKIAAWLNSGVKELLREGEYLQITRLVDYLDVVDQPDTVQSPDSQIMQRDMTKFPPSFTNFYSQYDKRRGKNFAATFPSFVKWMS